MALLSVEERKQLAEKGIYVKEKCDKCGQPILSELSYIKNKGKEVWCPKCAKGHDLVSANLKEEMSMAKQKAGKKEEAKERKDKGETTKIAGHLIPGTAIADLYQYLEDEKKHSLKDTLKAIAKHKADKMGRLQQLKRYGKRFGLWAVTIDEDTVQMKLGKGAAKAAEKDDEDEKPAKKADKKAKKVNGKEEEETDGTSSKQQQSIQKLVRRTLKGKGEWTKNKVVEHLKEEHELDPKRVQAAIQAEIKLGGIEEEGGVLQLV